jgi:hypothetical protein
MRPIAIAVAVVLQQILGASYYGLLGEAWAGAVGRPIGDFASASGAPYIVSLVASIIGCAALNWLLVRFGALDLPGAATLGGLIGVAFIAPALAVHYSFALYSPLLMAIDSISSILSWLLAAAVIALIRR